MGMDDPYNNDVATPFHKLNWKEYDENTCPLPYVKINEIHEKLPNILKNNNGFYLELDDDLLKQRIHLYDLMDKFRFLPMEEKLKATRKSIIDSFFIYFNFIFDLIYLDMFLGYSTYGKEATSRIVDKGIVKD